MVDKALEVIRKTAPLISTIVAILSGVISASAIAMWSFATMSAKLDSIRETNKLLVLEIKSLDNQVDQLDKLYEASSAATIERRASEDIRMDNLKDRIQNITDYIQMHEREWREK